MSSFPFFYFAISLF